MRNAKKTTTTAEWLTANMRNGRRRIETLGWKRLAAIYATNRLSIPKTSSASKSNRCKLVLEFDDDFQVWSERPDHVREPVEMT